MLDVPSGPAQLSYESLKKKEEVCTVDRSDILFHWSPYYSALFPSREA